MPITVDWYNVERTALLYTYKGSWTWGDFDEAVGQGNALMQSVPYTVHVVLNLSNAFIIPSDIISTTRRRHISSLAPTLDFAHDTFGFIDFGEHELSKPIRLFSHHWNLNRCEKYGLCFELNTNESE